MIIASNLTTLLVIMCVNCVLSINVFKNRTRIIATNLMSRICGQDNLDSNTVNEGPANIENYPWLGMLLYPYDSPRRSGTTVILISRQIAIGSALDIDHYPKDDFRSRSRVILGHNCTNSPTYRVVDYSIHPEFTSTTYNTVALVQLDTKSLTIRVFPICAPPEDFDSPENIFALAMSHDCSNSSMVKVYSMIFVGKKDCEQFYRKAELDVASMWPTHMACGKALHGGHCVWHSGTALVIRDKGQWKLLGIGVYGPGCESPARFIDFGMYYNWAKQSIKSIGEPAISRIAPNIIILRRTVSSFQRFGTCDPEESKVELFTDRVYLRHTHFLHEGYVRYNLTLLEHVDYNCILLRVVNDPENGNDTLPRISLSRWCNAPKALCTKLSKLIVYFYMEIRFSRPCVLKIDAYGNDVKYSESKAMMRFANNKSPHPIITENKFGKQ